MIDTELLQEKLNKSSFTMTFVAKELGITYQALLNKLNNKREFTYGEIISLGRLLHLKGKEVNKIFFMWD